MYGENFPQLVAMAPQWAARNVDSIFPLDPEEQPLLDAAWDAYLGGAPLTSEASALLAAVYSAMR